MLLAAKADGHLLYGNTEELPEPVYVLELLLDVVDNGSNGDLGLLISDDDDSLLAPSSWAMKPTAVDRTVSPSNSQDLDMQEVCKHGAAS